MIYSTVVRAKNNRTPLHLACGSVLRGTSGFEPESVVQYLVEEAGCDISEYTPPTV